MIREMVTPNPIVESTGMSSVASVELSAVQVEECLLGRGAFCDVWAAWWNNERVAIKRIRGDLSRGTEAIARKDLEREIAILSQIKPHEHIIRLVATGPGPFVLLERLTTQFGERFGAWKAEADRLVPASVTRQLAWVCGPSCVRGLVRRRGVLWTARIGAARDLAAALAHLHGTAVPMHRVAYRDLKPSNLGFDGDRLILFDFGLAKLLPMGGTDSPPVPMTPETGSVRYMSPEVALGEPYDHSCDIYSFGILLWQLCALEIPFAHMTPAMHRQDVVLGGERPPIGHSDWSESLCSLLANCWAASPRARLTAESAVTALDRELRDQTAALL
ncbi:hypothetical protein CTAYLR_008957 [Chrysophaeum taylorii]|uniref:Protein kinase domain-containing protein n=1 Tax=Chrysophaeum taylorii TaxID=2483200 RepID=A0AAD7UP18_9STRA|nr:hypothetical protein CTAYLR_008957 [Chrysophaeum taylorii]